MEKHTGQNVATYRDDVPEPVDGINKRESSSRTLMDKEGLSRKIEHLEFCVNEALVCVDQWKASVDEEIEICQFDRMQDTLSALLRNRVMKRMVATDPNPEEREYTAGTGDVSGLGTSSLSVQSENKRDALLPPKKREVFRTNVLMAMKAERQAIRASFPSLQADVSGAVIQALCKKQWETLKNEELERCDNGWMQNTTSVLWETKALNQELISNLRSEGQEGITRVGNANSSKTSHLNTVSDGTNKVALPFKKRRLLRLGMFRAVEADCKAVRARYPSLQAEVSEEYGLPVVSCTYANNLMKLPCLVLRVEQGYLQNEGVRYGFERPAMGWIGPLSTMKRRFKSRLNSGPLPQNAVSATLIAWADAVASTLTEMS